VSDNQTSQEDRTRLEDFTKSGYELCSDEQSDSSDDNSGIVY